MAGRIAFETIIVGAGLAGLSAAYHLQERNMLILERDALPGGRIRTRKIGTDYYDIGAVLGYDREYAPPDFSPPAAFKEPGPLGVFFDGHLYHGESVGACLSAIIPQESAEFSNMLAVGNGTLSPTRLPHKHRDLLNAFFQVIHPGDIEEYLPAFHSHAFVRYYPQHYPTGNYGLVEAFCQRIPAPIEYEATVVSVTRTGDLIRVSFKKDGRTQDAHARCVIVATPAPIAAAVISDPCEPCRRFLQSVRYGRFTVVALGFDAFSCNQDFSYLVTPDLPMTTIYKMTFPGSRTTVFLVYYCNHASQETWQVPDDELIARTKADMTRVGLDLESAEQRFAEVHRWEHGGTIIAPESYASWDEDVVQAAPGIYLAGDYVHREFPYGMDAAVKSGLTTAQHVRRFLQLTCPPGTAERDRAKQAALSSPLLTRCFHNLTTLVRKASQQPIPMMCIPPAPRTPFPFGDLVPLGFLLQALRRFADQHEAVTLITALERLLSENKQRDLWAFHRGHLITATDSALILLGLNDVKAVEALEMFHDGQDGYYPQLWSEEPRPNYMQCTRSVSHWCQADYATTCLVRGLRMRHGLTSHTSLAYLAEGFERRSGLYFANPYLVDWAFALAIHCDDRADELCNRLLQDVCASQNNDASFGGFDHLLSTALAVLTLAALGSQGDRILQAQRWMEEELDRHPTPARPIPFYSSELLDDDPFSFQTLLQLKMLNGDRIATVGKTYHAISYYEDRTTMIVSALTALALGVPVQGVQVAKETSDTMPACHPRYQCRTQAEYIARFALPPYIRSV